MGLLGRDKVAFNWIQSLDTMVSGHVDGTQIGRAHEIAVCTRALLLTCFWGSVGDLWGGFEGMWACADDIYNFSGFGNSGWFWWPCQAEHRLRTAETRLCRAMQKSRPGTWGEMPVDVITTHNTDARCRWVS